MDEWVRSRVRREISGPVPGFFRVDGRKIGAVIFGRLLTHGATRGWNVHRGLGSEWVGGVARIVVVDVIGPFPEFSSR